MLPMRFAPSLSIVVSLYPRMQNDAISPPTVAQNLSDAALTGTSAFDYADIAASADYEGMLARLRDFDPDNYALSIINPTED